MYEYTSQKKERIYLWWKKLDDPLKGNIFDTTISNDEPYHTYPKIRCGIWHYKYNSNRTQHAIFNFLNNGPPELDLKHANGLYISHFAIKNDKLVFDDTDAHLSSVVVDLLMPDYDYKILCSGNEGKIVGNRDTRWLLRLIDAYDTRANTEQKALIKNYFDPKVITAFAKYQVALIAATQRTYWRYMPGVEKDKKIEELKVSIGESEQHLMGILEECVGEKGMEVLEKLGVLRKKVEERKKIHCFWHPYAQYAQGGILTVVHLASGLRLFYGLACLSANTVVKSENGFKEPILKLDTNEGYAIFVLYTTFACRCFSRCFLTHNAYNIPMSDIIWFCNVWFTDWADAPDPFMLTTFCLLADFIFDLCINSIQTPMNLVRFGTRSVVAMAAIPLFCTSQPVRNYSSDIYPSDSGWFPFLQFFSKDIDNLGIISRFVPSRLRHESASAVYMLPSLKQTWDCFLQLESTSKPESEDWSDLFKGLFIYNDKPTTADKKRFLWNICSSEVRAIDGHRMQHRALPRLGDTRYHPSRYSNREILALGNSPCTNEDYTQALVNLRHSRIYSKNYSPTCLPDGYMDHPYEHWKANK